MKTVYALQFDIFPEFQDTNACLEEIKTLLAEWVKKKYKRAWKTEFELSSFGKPIYPLANHSVVTSIQESEEFQFLSFDWTHPDDQDASLFWKTICTFCANKNMIEVSIVVRIESGQFIVKPVMGYIVGKPGIVDDILSKYDCKISSEKISVKPMIIREREVESFVQNYLENKDRVCPIVLLSQDVWTDRPFVDPVLLQKKLLGLAKVVVIDKLAGFELTAIVGKQLSCYNGAIRIYWSGFTRAANPFYYQLYLQEKMESYKEEGSFIESHLFRLLANIASLRYAEGPLTRQAIQSFKTNRNEELFRIRKELQENKLNIDEIYPALEKSWNENDQFQRELSESKERIQELECELANYKENLANLYEYQDSTKLDLIDKIEIPEFKTVLEAVVEANKRFQNANLVIWENSIETAKKSNFVRPNEVFEALKAISEIGNIYFESLKNNEPMGPWEQLFEARGFKYAPSDSRMTINLYGGERLFSNHGEKKQMLKHLTLGGGDRNNCLQIYFEPNEERNTIDVGYCGVHLSYYSQ